MIGIFDSGSGGLSVVSALRERAPQADMLYFGDIKNAPYGSRSSEELEQLVTNGISYLAKRGASEIIAACNSISASILQGVTGHDRLIEMTRPTARALRAFAGERALLLATPATVRSGIYRDALEPILTLDQLPVPELAGAIERGAKDDAIAKIVRDAFETKKGEHYDRIILGCTHYPLVEEVIADEAERAFQTRALFDPAQAVADEAAMRFSSSGTGSITFVISQDSHEFRNRVAPLFFETPCTLEVL